MTRTTRSVDDWLSELMTGLGVPADPLMRAALAAGVAARVNRLVASGVRSPPHKGLSWGDLHICLRLEWVAMRSKAARSAKDSPRRRR